MSLRQKMYSVINNKISHYDYDAYYKNQTEC